MKVFSRSQNNLELSEAILLQLEKYESHQYIKNACELWVHSGTHRYENKIVSKIDVKIIPKLVYQLSVQI